MDKNIYKFNDGEKDVYLDPFDMDIRYNDALIDVDIDEKMSIIERKDANPIIVNKALKELAPGIFAMFNLSPVDPSTGKGTTFETALELWAEYMEWRSGVKKNTTEPPSSPPSTPEADQSSVMEALGFGNIASAGNSNSASGSTVEPPSPASPQPSVMA